MIRDMVIAMVFGAGVLTDLFFIAFRIPDFVRKLLSEGVLGLAVVPAFSRLLQEQGRARAAHAALSILLRLSAFVTLACTAAMLFMPVIFMWLMPGLGYSSDQGRLCLIMFQIMIPYMGALCILTFFMGVLNALEHFTVPACGPVVFNLVIIGVTVFLSSFMPEPILAIPVGVTLGGCVQLAMQVPVLMRYGMFRHRTVPRKDLSIGISRVLTGAAPAAKQVIASVVGAAGYPINLLVSTLIVSMLESGNVSFLYYSDRLIQFCLGLFSVSISIVMLPALSRLRVEEDKNRITETFLRMVQYVFFITLPAMVGLMVLRVQVVELLFCRGAFTMPMVRQTADCLWYLGMGIWALAGVRMTVTLYQVIGGQGHVKGGWPFQASLTACAVHGVLSWRLTASYGLAGAAAALSLAAMLQFFLLVIRMDGLWNQAVKVIGRFILKSIIASLIMGGVVTATSALIFIGNYDTTVLIWGTIGCIGCGVLLYLGIHMCISRPELAELKQLIGKRKH